MTKPFTFSIAPDKLWQAINPWTFYNQGAQFGLINVAIGQTPHPEIEEDILEEVGSYGRQLGRIGDVVEILLDHVPLEGLDKKERRKIEILRGQLAQIDAIKDRELDTA